MKLPEDVLIPMLRKFASNIGELAVKLSAMRVQGDFGAIQDEIHQLKGVAGSLGMYEILATATALDEAAKSSADAAVAAELEALTPLLAETAADIHGRYGSSVG